MTERPAFPAILLGRVWEQVLPGNAARRVKVCCIDGSSGGRADLSGKDGRGSRPPKVSEIPGQK